MVLRSVRMPQDAQPRMEGSDVFNRTLQRLEQTYAVRSIFKQGPGAQDDI